MPKLHEVFGISASVPKYTYVDRLGLDSQFEYFLTADRHIVVHGGSKQGKTVLRRKHLTEAQSIVVSCGPNDTVDSIYERILTGTGAKVPSTTGRKSTTEVGGSVEGSGGIELPFIAKLGAKGEARGSKAVETMQVDEFVGSKVSIDTVITAIRASRRTLVIEDFHYLAEDERRKLAFALKALWDSKTFVIIVGIWAEQNRLTFYNGDLSGRVEEVDVRWQESELRSVVKEGEKALNISISPSCTNELIRDANANVGLLQRLLEGICREAEIVETAMSHQTIGSADLLQKCRVRVCASAERRYFSFANVVSRGFKNPEKTKLKLYRQIVRACVDKCTDDELINGIDREVLLAKVQMYEPDADLQNLQKALILIDRLQAERGINPPVLSYEELSRRLILVDRELLFFRKYSDKKWPWDSGYTDSYESEDDA